MSKRIETPQPEETVTIPKSSFDNIFRAMEEMKAEISGLKSLLAEKRTEPERIFSQKEAADYCGVSRWTIGNYIKWGKLKRVERGGRVGILKSELDKIKSA